MQELLKKVQRDNPWKKKSNKKLERKNFFSKHNSKEKLVPGELGPTKTKD